MKKLFAFIVVVVLFFAIIHDANSQIHSRKISMQETIVVEGTEFIAPNEDSFFVEYATNDIVQKWSDKKKTTSKIGDRCKIIGNGENTILVLREMVNDTSSVLCLYKTKKNAKDCPCENETIFSLKKAELAPLAELLPDDEIERRENERLTLLAIKKEKTKI